MTSYYYKSNFYDTLILKITSSQPELDLKHLQLAFFINSRSEYILSQQHNLSNTMCV